MENNYRLKKKTISIILLISNSILFSQIKTDSFKLKGHTIKIIEYSLFKHQQTSVYYHESLIDSFEIKPESNILGKTTMDSIKHFVKNKGYLPTGLSICNFEIKHETFNPDIIISNPFTQDNFPSYVLDQNKFEFDLFHIKAIDYYYSKTILDNSDSKSLLNLTKLWISYLGSNISYIKVKELKPETLIDKVLTLSPNSIEANTIKAQLHFHFIQSVFHNQKEEKKLSKVSAKQVLKLDSKNKTALEILSKLKKK